MRVLLKVIAMPVQFSVCFSRSQWIGAIQSPLSLSGQIVITHNSGGIIDPV